MSCVAHHRARIGVLIPSTNTVVEYEYARLAPAGVSVHAGRMYVPRPSVANDADTTALVEDVRANVGTALRDLLTCRPDVVLTGMSAITFYGGLAGARAYREGLQQQAARPVISASLALLDAVRSLGAGRAAVLSPYQPVNDIQVRAFFSDARIHLTGYESLRCTSATQIAEVDASEVEPAVERLANSRPDVIVQVGTNLWFADLASRLTSRLGMPVIAINTATFEAGLRAVS